MSSSEENDESADPADGVAWVEPTEAQLETEIPGGRLASNHDPYVALRDLNFRYYISSSFLRTISQKALMAATGWEVYAHSHSALKLGWLGLAMVLPNFLFSLPAGHLADQLDRKRILLITSLINMACAIAFVVLSRFFIDWSGWLASVYALLFFNATAGTFARTARQSLLPRIIPGEHFTNAVTWQSSTIQLSAMIGPALGGLLIAISIPLAYVVSALAMMASALLIVPIRLNAPAAKSAVRKQTANSWDELTAGIRFIWTTKLLLGAMSMDLFAVLLGGATYLLPIYAQRLGVGAIGFGWLRAAPAFGSFSSAIILAHLPPMQRAGRTLMTATIGFGLATIIFGLSGSFPLSLAMLYLTGLFDNVSVVIRQSLLQLMTPDEMRGRVSAVNIVFVGSSDELGGLESGLTAAAFGPVASVVGGGIGTLLAVFSAAMIWPSLRQLRSLRHATLQSDRAHSPEKATQEMNAAHC